MLEWLTLRVEGKPWRNTETIVVKVASQMAAQLNPAQSTNKAVVGVDGRSLTGQIGCPQGVSKVRGPQDRLNEVDVLPLFICISHPFQLRRGIGCGILGVLV